MTLKETGKGLVTDVYVKPKSKKFQVKLEYDELVVWCKEPPVKGRVNRELIKRLSKFFNRRVRILSGYTTRQKKLLIEDISLEEADHLLNSR